MTWDKGALLENLVYLKLRREEIHPGYYLTNKGLEVDFYYKKGRGDTFAPSLLVPGKTGHPRKGVPGMGRSTRRTVACVEVSRDPRGREHG